MICVMIFGYVTFKMAALWFWTMFNCNRPIAPCYPLRRQNLMICVMIFSYVTFKMAALWFWTMFNCNPPIAPCYPLLWGGGILVNHWSTISSLPSNQGVQLFILDQMNSYKSALLSWWLEYSRKIKSIPWHWWPGSLRWHVISSHGINCVGYVGICLLWGRFFNDLHH